MTLARPIRPWFLLLVVIGLTTVATAHASAQPIDDRPDDPRIVSIDGTRGNTAVTGINFTPGGSVYIAIHDQWGDVLLHVLESDVGADVYGPNGSADPALGYIRGGEVTATLDIPCGAHALVRIYDAESALWSNWLDIDPDC